ncbi:MAG: thiamine ABC transporter substrate-binding protein [Treponema sp.]|jgi:thiamine transport system substrate-binding protein|nr:thiamine ABC transporter substrate-binding protein [Treponema sp.]
MRKNNTVLRQILFSGILLFVFALFPGYAKANREKTVRQQPSPEVVVWTYDSFNSEWGPGPEATKRFLAETGITIKWVSHGDAGELLSRLLLEGNNAGADVVLGLDQNLAERALTSGLLEAYKPKGADAIFPNLVFDTTYRLTPLDYSYFAIIYDSQRIHRPPQSLEDLTGEAYNNQLILMDPRTSSPGLGFLAWTLDVYGEDWKAYWHRLGPSILTIADGWSSGYGLFTAGEAPMVLSYTTSPGVHLEYEGTERYQAALFTEGHPMQIEVAGLLVGSKNKENAKKFLDFMVSSSFQAIIPLTNWMYPVIAIPLPASFRINPKSDKTRYPATPTDRHLTEWAELMTQLPSR